MNKLILTGRLVRDCEISNTEFSTSYLRNSLAVKKNFKNKDGEYETDFYNFVAFGKTADYISNYCYKGDLVLLNGRLSMSKITDENQKRINVIDVICEEIEILGKAKREFEAKADNRVEELEKAEQKRQDFLNVEIKNDISADDLPF